MKKLKLLPTLLMLALCVGVLAIGVYAITPAKNTISGTITINSSNPAFTINLYKSEVNSQGSAVGERTKINNEPYTIRSGDELSLGDLSFNTSTANEVSDVNQIKIDFEVTSTATVDLGMYFSKVATPTPSISTEAISLGDGTVSGKFNNYTKLPKEATATTSIVFELKTIPTGEKIIDLKDNTISLNIVDYDSSMDTNSDEYYASNGYQVIGTSGSAVSSSDYNTDDKSSLTKIKIAEGVTAIADNAFYECSELSEVVIPGSVKTIGENAFDFCTKLCNVTLMEGVEEIESSAFSKAGSSEMGDDHSQTFAIVLPSSLRIIGGGAFADAGITHIEIPNTVTEIGDNAFYPCWYLKTITIKAGTAKEFGSLYMGGDSEPMFSYKLTKPDGSTVTCDGTTKLTRVAEGDYIYERIDN